jgi:hypothetical protein
MSTKPTVTQAWSASSACAQGKSYPTQAYQRWGSWGYPQTPPPLTGTARAVVPGTRVTGTPVLSLGPTQGPQPREISGHFCFSQISWSCVREPWRRLVRMAVLSTPPQLQNGLPVGCRHLSPQEQSEGNNRTEMLSGLPARQSTDDTVWPESWLCPRTLILMY